MTRIGGVDVIGIRRYHEHAAAAQRQRGARVWPITAGVAPNAPFRQQLNLLGSGQDAADLGRQLVWQGREQNVAVATRIERLFAVFGLYEGRDDQHGDVARGIGGFESPQ